MELQFKIDSSHIQEELKVFSTILEAFSEAVKKASNQGVVTMGDWEVEKIDAPQSLPQEQAEQPQEEKQEMSIEDWQEINKAKREELLIAEGMERAKLRVNFNSFALAICQTSYGAPKPSMLSPQDLWKYAQEFKQIVYNKECETDSKAPYFIVKCPF